MEQFPTLKGKAFAFLLLAWFMFFLSYLSRTILSPILPVVEDEFAISHARASSIFILISVGYALSLLLSGVSLRVLGSKKSIVSSMLLAAAAYFVVPFFRTFEYLYVSAFFIGVAAGMYLPSMIPLLTSYYHKSDWGKVLAIHDSGSGISCFAAPIIVTGLLPLLPWRGMFLVIAVTMVGCAIVFSLVAEEGKAAVAGGGRFSGSLWKRKELWFMGIVTVFITGCAIGLYYIIPLYLIKELGIASGPAYTVLWISRIGGVVVGISTGFFVDRFSPRLTMFSLTLAAGLMTVAVTTTRDIGWIRVLFFAQASLVMGVFPIMFLALSRLFEDETRGQATGLLLTLGSIFGAGIIPYLLGLSGDLVGFRFGIALLGTVSTLSSGLVLFLNKLD